ncbi:MAG: hypothetical protein HY015_06515, partial [Bacteroidetes bacterium]|nr:hypothetical protein [Bacteroidota bacterium]
DSHVIQGPALPFERKLKKQRYLLLPKKTYKQALRALQTVPMKPVYSKIGEDSMDIKKALDSAARSITDTLSASVAAKPKEQEEDSVYVITKEKEKFNLDQDNYMWYFRDILVLPDVKKGIDAAKAEKEGASPAKAKQGFFSKLKNLFKKKPKQKIDTTAVKPVNQPEEENYDSERDSTVVQPQAQPIDPPSVTKKADSKKKSKAKTSPPAKKQDAKKEEKDGF